MTPTTDNGTGDELVGSAIVFRRLAPDEGAVLTSPHTLQLRRNHGLAGMCSEETAAHPHSQKANLAIGAKETCFLLGWIAASLANDAAIRAARDERPSSAGGVPLREAERRARATRLRPRRHREVVGRTLDLCALRNALRRRRRHRLSRTATTPPRARSIGEPISRLAV